MADFACALKEGMAAAEKASRARGEIDGVFAELDDQIAEATKGRLTISIEDAPNSWQGASRTLTEAFQRPLKASQAYSAVVARNPLIKDGPAKVLAVWVPHRQGYPCKIAWSGQERYCEDRESLENCLADLIRDPGVAEQLATLVRLEPSQDALETARQ